MDNHKKESRSMYLYTALIFVVALLLILVSSFSQTNISKLGNRANEFATSTPLATDPPSAKADELAKIANMAAELDAKNESLTLQLEQADKLFTANAYIKNSQFDEAEMIISELDETTLSDNQKILLEDIKIKINEGKDV